MTDKAHLPTARHLPLQPKERYPACLLLCSFAYFALYSAGGLRAICIFAKLGPSNAQLFIHNTSKEIIQR